MRWPLHAVETVRPSRFFPPHCAHPECPAHLRPGSGFQRNGGYVRKADPKRVPRFRCLECGRSSSRQTFSCTYYLKRPELLVPIATGLQAGSAHRQLARSLGCSKTTVTRMAERLTRHALLFHTHAMRELEALPEHVLHDHFEGFVHRQDEALGIGTAVGSRSWFVYDIDPAPHRGAGRRPDRKPKSAALQKIRRAYVESINRSIDRLFGLVPKDRRLVLIVDGRPDYRVAKKEHPQRDRIDLRVYPNPERGPKGSPRSPEARARDRAMAPIDHLHQLLRHTCAEHKRETIAFGRRLESVVGRGFLTAVWRNWVKGRSERAPDRRTPAMLLGLAREPWSWGRVLAKRIFPTRERLREVDRRLYFRALTPEAPRHHARHAY